jgi:hypothetical protein
MADRIVSSYVSDKCRKGRHSVIEGGGLHAVAVVKAGEVVAVKGGHIIDRATLLTEAEVIGNSDVQITDQLYLAALTLEEYEAVMLYLNHSCEPNVGVAGNVVFVAMREIAAGEELTIDYAMIDDSQSSMECHCGTASCRGRITGEDWRLPALQERYGPYFSWYLQSKIGMGST